MAKGTGLGAMLRQRREEAGLTQQELADRAGVSWETISRWERETREPSWSAVLSLASALGVQVTAFVPAEKKKQPATGRKKPTG